jgi:hypothetical protein
MNDVRSTVFKKCPKCGNVWESAASLMSDPAIRLLGYQPGADGHRAGFFLFHHVSCATSLAVGLEAFAYLTSSPMLVPSRCARGMVTDFCVAELEHEPWPLHCVCQYVWTIMERIQAWPKELAHSGV